MAMTTEGNINHDLGPEGGGTYVVNFDSWGEVMAISTRVETAVIRHFKNGCRMAFPEPP